MWLYKWLVHHQKCNSLQFYWMDSPIWLNMWALTRQWFNTFRTFKIIQDSRKNHAIITFCIVTVIILIILRAKIGYNKFHKMCMSICLSFMRRIRMKFIHIIVNSFDSLFPVLSVDCMDMLNLIQISPFISLSVCFVARERI